MFGETSNIPLIIQNLGLALITTFIPVGIFIFSSAHSSVLDKKIAIHSIVKGEVFFLGIVGVFLPYLFWGIVTDNIRLLLFVLSVFGILTVSIRIYKSYRWIISDNKHQVRIKFLNEELQESLLLESWKSVWSMEETTDQEFGDFFEVFKDKIDGRIGGGDTDIKTLNQVIRLLEYFSSGFQLKNLRVFTIFDELFSVILDWYFISWERHQEFVASNRDKAKRILYTRLHRILKEKIVDFVFEDSMQKGYSFETLECLRRHVDEYGDRLKNGRSYLYDFSIYSILFANIMKANESELIFIHNFPETWKVTLKNIDSYPMSKYWYQHYEQWAHLRLRFYNARDDHALDYISRYLFPDIDPIVWSILLTFMLRSYGDSRVKSYIEQDRIFGLYGRVGLYHSEAEISIDFQQQKQNTYKLVVALINKKWFGDLEFHISELRKMEGERKLENQTEKNRKQLLIVLEELKIEYDKIE